MTSIIRPFAIVTGASTGIGYELAKCCAAGGFNLLIAADEPRIEQAAQDIREMGVAVESLETDLATQEGVEKLYAAIQGRSVDALLANAGHGLGGAFLDQDFSEVRHVIDTNITGTIYLVQKVGRDMRAQSAGRILITGSIAGFIPGTYQAVYNGTKAFIDSFSFALRAELKGTGVTVTCLMPGATETEFFERADMMDTKVGQQEKDETSLWFLEADPMVEANSTCPKCGRGAMKLIPSLEQLAPKLPEQNRLIAECDNCGHRDEVKVVVTDE